MPKLRSLILALALCGFTSTASADDFWTAPFPGYAAPLYAVPTYVAPAYMVPAYAVPTYVAPTYVIPTYVAPTYVAPAVIVPSVTVPSVGVVPPVPAYGVPVYASSPARRYHHAWPAYAAPSYVVSTQVYDEPPCDDYTDLLILDQLESMNQTLRDIEYNMRETRHQEAWGRLIDSYRH